MAPRRAISGLWWAAPVERPRDRELRADACRRLVWAVASSLPAYMYLGRGPVGSFIPFFWGGDKRISPPS